MANDPIVAAVQADHPDSNPKTRYGVLKTPLHLIPPPAKHGRLNDDRPILETEAAHE